MDSPPPGRRGQGWRRKTRSQPISENRSNLIDSPHPYPSPLGAGSQQEPVFWKKEPSNFQKQPFNFRKQPSNFRKQPPIDNLIPYSFHLIPARFSYACSGQLSDLGLIK